jgi:hypothetical protein
MQQPYPQQPYPQQPYPQPQQQAPPQWGQEQAPPQAPGGLEDLMGAALDPSAIQGIAEKLGMPGLDSILSNLMNLNAGGQEPQTPAPTINPPSPATPTAGMTTMPNIPGMSFDSPQDEYEDDDEYEYVDDDDDEGYEDDDFEEEEEDMLGSEGRQLASALYMVIMPIYTKKDRYDSIEAMETDIKTQAIEVFRTKGLELFTPDILEDWCVEASEALESNKESESAANIYNALSKVNRIKIRTFGGKIAEQIIKNTITTVLASLRDSFYPSE